MNTKYNRYDVDDVIISLTTRSLRDWPTWDSDVTKASRDIQMFADMRTKIITVALGDQRPRISMQMNQIKVFDSPLIKSSYKRLVKSDAKVLDVMYNICPSIQSGSKFCVQQNFDVKDPNNATSVFVASRNTNLRQCN